MSDSELLAVLLGIRARGSAGCHVANHLLQTFGGLHRLFAGRTRSVLEIAGIGLARAARISAAIELGRRHLETPAFKTSSLKNPQDAAVCFQARFADLAHEAFGCVFLDTRHRIICFEPLFNGTVDGATVYPREVLKRALHHNAAAVIVGHNHPSGDCEPSEADRVITLKLKQSLALIDIRLLDHLVVCRGSHASLAERGWL